jgi:hypothetical protein
MSIATLDPIVSDQATDDEHPPRAHYFDKADLARVITNDAVIEALCGRKDQPLLAGDGLPVCEKCQAVYNTMRNE